MENDMIKKASEDLNLIRQVIEKTTGSFISFSHIFILWGLSFIAVAGLAYLINIPTNIFTALPWLNYLLLPLFLLISVFVFIAVTRNRPLRGLSKQLIMFWLFVISINFLIAMITNPSPEWMIFSFSIGLFCTYIFTEFKSLLWASLTYLVLGLLYTTLFSSGPIIITVAILNGVFPFTFILLGVFFSSKKVIRSK